MFFSLDQKRIWTKYNEMGFLDLRDLVVSVISKYPLFAWFQVPLVLSFLHSFNNQVFMPVDSWCTPLPCCMLSFQWNFYEFGVLGDLMWIFYTCPSDELRRNKKYDTEKMHKIQQQTLESLGPSLDIMAVSEKTWVQRRGFSRITIVLAVMKQRSLEVPGVES